jgi:hypothetical protein
MLRSRWRLYDAEPRRAHSASSSSRELPGRIGNFSSTSSGSQRNSRIFQDLLGELPPTFPTDALTAGLQTHGGLATTEMAPATRIAFSSHLASSVHVNSLSPMSQVIDRMSHQWRSIPPSRWVGIFLGDENRGASLEGSSKSSLDHIPVGTGGPTRTLVDSKCAP